MTNAQLMLGADKVAAKPKAKGKTKKPLLGSAPRGVEPLAYTVKQTATRLGISAERAYAAVNAGQIPAIVLGKRKVVPAAALEKMLRGE